MNWILVCLFNLILFNSCLTVNVNRALSSGWNQQQNRSGNGVQAEAFNEDFMFPIFDLAELEQIVQLAKNPESAEFVKNTVFPVKYPNYTFVLLSDENQEVTMGRDCACIPDFNLFLDLITHFGDQIKKLGIYVSETLSEEDTATLNNLISEHCSDSLTTLSFGCIVEHTFTNLTKPFPNINRLQIQIKTDQVGALPPFDEIFPNVESFFISYSAGANNNQNNGNRFIDGEFPAMEHLNYLSLFLHTVSDADVVTIEKQFESIFHKNPKIRTLWYSHKLNDDLIHEIEEYLPNLEYLSVRNIEAEIRPVHFENVKHLLLTWSHDFPADKITFSSLESLQMYYELNYSNGSIRNSWMQFFRNHQNLSKIICHTIEEEGVVEFLAELPNLHEIHISSFMLFDINLVSQLIDGHSNLVKLRYDAGLNNAALELDMSDFLEKYGHEWKITYNLDDQRFIELERKN